jgi:hypothetical protein
MRFLDLQGYTEALWNENQRLIAENAALSEHNKEAASIIDSIVQASLQNQPEAAIDPPVYAPPLRIGENND